LLGVGVWVAVAVGVVVAGMVAVGVLGMDSTVTKSFPQSGIERTAYTLLVLPSWA